MEFNYEMRVPKERVAVLIGKGGETRKLLVEKLDVGLSIDSQEGIAELTADDGLKLMVAKDVVKAIARGFNPEVALKLLHEDYFLDIINITDFVGDKKNQLARVKARVIGREGKARKTMAVVSDCEVVVFGKTVGIIGKYQYVSLVRRAVETLISGNKHGYVYKWLEEKCVELRKQEYN